MRFDYGRYNTNIAAFEAGVTAEYYLNEMPLMAYVPPQALFLQCLYRHHVWQAKVTG